jgi:hypothetical protein
MILTQADITYAMYKLHDLYWRTDKDLYTRQNDALSKVFDNIPKFIAVKPPSAAYLRLRSNLATYCCDMDTLEANELSVESMAGYIKDVFDTAISNKTNVDKDLVDVLDI